MAEAEDERTLAQIAYDAWSSVDRADSGVMECWEAAATAVRDKVRRETIEECAAQSGPLAETWRNAFQLGARLERIASIERLRGLMPLDSDPILDAAKGALEHGISLTRMSPLPSPPCVPGRD